MNIAPEDAVASEDLIRKYFRGLKKKLLFGILYINIITNSRQNLF
jgi:hypothetical protein